MKRFKCLLLDANVVIKLFSLGLWDALVKQCEIHLSEIVVTESNFYEDSEGNRHDINLAAYIRDGQIQIFSHPLPRALRTLSGVAGDSTHLPIALWMAMMTRCVFASEWLIPLAP